MPSVNVVRCSFPVFAARRLARGLLRSLTLHPAYGPVLVAPPLVAEAFDALFPRPVWWKTHARTGLAEVEGYLNRPA